MYVDRQGNLTHPALAAFEQRLQNFVNAQRIMDAAHARASTSRSPRRRMGASNSTPAGVTIPKGFDESLGYKVIDWTATSVRMVAARPAVAAG
jgi:hypothetical protein